MTVLKRLLDRVRGRKQLEFADDARTGLHRDAINAFLHKVLGEDEQEFIDTDWISDEATIFDCSMDMPATWIANCRAAYNLDIPDRLHMPLWELACWVRKEVGHGHSTQ